MRVLITGASGMLGAALTVRWQSKYDVYSTGRSHSTVTHNERYLTFDFSSKNFAPLIKWSSPDVIIHCGAITDLEYCEKNIHKAMEINGESVRRLLDCCESAKIIFISSDAVFPSSIHMATENDRIEPMNVYGRSKALGEQYIREAGPPHALVRTTPVGFNINPEKTSFVEWVIQSITKGDEISMHEDVVFSPISVCHLSNAVEEIVGHDLIGTWHIASHDSIKKYDFGIDLAVGLDLDTGLIKKGALATFQSNVSRSTDQSLDSSKFEIRTKRFLPKVQQTIETLVIEHKEIAYG